jgi:sugar lactone lactonase YvrE
LLAALAPLATLQAQLVYPTPFTITTLAGTAGIIGLSDGTGSAAQFNSPYGVAVDGSGNVYIADKGNHTIRKITSTGVVTTLAGAAGYSGFQNGTGSAAQFWNPNGVAVDSAGNVYVADTSNCEIRKITATGVVTTLAGAALSPGSIDGPASVARFSYPTGLAVDSAGNIYVVDSASHTIRKITSAGMVTTLAGTANNGGSSDGTGSAAQFEYPFGVAVDSDGNVYVADTGNLEIRKITAAGVVTTLAGAAFSRGSIDGSGSVARFNTPRSVAVDGAGNIYVADEQTRAIRKITATGVVTTIAGDALHGGATDGTGSSALFYAPSGVAVDNTGKIYVADSDPYGNTIRKGTPPVTPAPAITTQPANQTVTVGGSASFTAAASGNPSPTLRWQRLPAGSVTWANLSDAGSYSGSTAGTLTVSTSTAQYERRPVPLRRHQLC